MWSVITRPNWLPHNHYVFQDTCLGLCTQFKVWSLSVPEEKCLEVHSQTLRLHTHAQKRRAGRFSQATGDAVNGGLDSSNNWLVIHELLIDYSDLLAHNSLQWLEVKACNLHLLLQFNRLHPHGVSQTVCFDPWVKSGWAGSSVSVDECVTTFLEQRGMLVSGRRALILWTSRLFPSFKNDFLKCGSLLKSLLYLL